jgi:cGMP-dependent protein kinase
VKAKGHLVCWVIIKSQFTEILDDAIRKQFLDRIELQDDTVGLEDLEIVKSLGSGMFGNVFLTVHKTKKILYALKTVDRRKIAAFEIQENIVLERKILLELDHIFIMKLVRTFKDQFRLYFLLEYIRGMDLFDVLREIGLLTESDSKFLTACLVVILEHLHERDIIYRDLKPENIVVDEEGYPKLIDFGTSKIIKGRTFTIVGTPRLFPFCRLLEPWGTQL